MKKLAYTIIALAVAFIFIPSLLELFDQRLSKFVATPSQTERIYKIAVVHKEKDHDASKKQADTIISAANYFSNVTEGKFEVQGTKYQLVEFYEDTQNGIICASNDPENQLKDVIAILGPITSSCSIKLLNNNPLEIPVITSFATAPNLNRDNKAFFFRTVPDDDIRVAELLKQWNPNIAASSFENNLVVYDSNNPYSVPSYELVKSYINDKHKLDVIDVSAAPDSNSYDYTIRYNTIFVMLNPDNVSKVIEDLKASQYSEHDGHKPKFVAKAEYADPFLFDSPDSLVAMTPTLVPYNLKNEMHFLTIERDKLKDRSASSFLAFEALYRAIEHVSKVGVDSQKCGQSSDTISKWRCGIIKRLKTPIRSELIGNEIKFHHSSGDVETDLLSDAEIRKLGSGFAFSRSDQKQPTLVNIKLEKNNRSMWLGAPQIVRFDAESNVKITVKFDYSAPDWITNTSLKVFLSKALSTQVTLNTDESPYKFHPMFIGTYNIQLGGLSKDLRQSAGRHQLNISPPVHLFTSIAIGIIVAFIVVTTYDPSVPHARKTRIITEVILSSLFLYFMTVTLRGYEFPLAPTLSFSDNALTNALYCGIIAGTIRLKIFNYFIAPIVKRFTPETPINRVGPPSNQAI